MTDFFIYITFRNARCCVLRKKVIQLICKAFSIFKEGFHPCTHFIPLALEITEIELLFNKAMLRMVSYDLKKQ